MAREPRDREGPIGVRLPASVKTALEAAAEANHRSLHGEVVARLTASVSPAIERREALGELLATVEARMAWLAGQIEREGRPQTKFLALLREGMDGLFDELGAADSPVGEDERAIARGIGQVTARDMLFAEPSAPPYPEHMHEQFETVRRLARTRDALGLRNPMDEDAPSPTVRSKTRKGSKS
jgi:hypothetical protein